MRHLHQNLMSKTPTSGRSYVRPHGLLVLFVLTLSRMATAQHVLDENEVVRLALEQSPSAAIAIAVDSVAEARSEVAAPLPNPRLGWSRENTPRATEDTLVATVPFDLARPSATRALVASDGAWMRAEAAAELDNAVLQSLLAYYEAAALAQQVELLSSGLGHLDEAARVLASREAAGSASGYETTRLAVARELSRSQLEEAKGELASARARLATTLGIVAEHTQLAPLSLRPVPPKTKQQDHAVLRRAEKSTELARRARDKANLGWLPTFEIGAGVKRVSEADVGYGYVVGLSVNIPVFDRGQTLTTEADALVTLSTARTDTLRRSLKAEADGARVAYEAAVKEFQRFDAETKAMLGVLLRAAESGYREGERSVLELLDAQRTETEVAQRRLDLLLHAKRSEARFRAAQEGFQ